MVTSLSPGRGTLTNKNEYLPTTKGSKAWGGRYIQYPPHLVESPFINNLDILVIGQNL